MKWERMTISILGCGWLGFPLALHLLNKGHKIKGSTTTESKIEKLNRSGIESYLLNITEDLNTEKNIPFWDCDTMIVNIPPGRNNPDVVNYFPEIIEK
ncbi:MAG: NAD(P)-binding domain-containing protein, partial [Balneolaceae bacterium]